LREKGVILSSFVSARGGSGATLLSVNVSAALARTKRVLLADFHICNSSVLLGMEDTDKDLVRNVLNDSIPLNSAISLLPAHASGLKIVTLSGFEGESAASFISKIAEGFDHIIFVARELNGPISEVLRKSNGIFLVAAPELPSLKKVPLVFKKLYSLHLEEERIKLILNKHSGSSQELFNVEAVCGRAPDFLVARDDSQALLSVNSGRLLAGRGDNRISAGVSFLTEHILSLLPAPVPLRTETRGKGKIQILEVKSNIHAKLIPFLREKHAEPGALNGSDSGELNARVREAVEELFASEAPSILDKEQRAVLVNEIIQEALGLGPLEDLLNDPEISEIMVNSKDSIFVERRGRLEDSGRSFRSDSQLLLCIERIVAPVGRRIDESSPMVDARLPDGSRVNAIIPPLALKGPCLTIRKFSKRKLKIEDLINSGSVTEEAAACLLKAVRARKNIVVSGGTGSGKTTLLNVISSFIPSDERIVTIEDSAELSLSQGHVVTLEARPANIEGKGAVTIRDLVRNALRMRPDRIIVGECRGGEAFDMLQAMNTGHAGSLTTLHSNSPRDTLSRIETMVLMAGMELPLRAIRDQAASAVDIIVHQERSKDGRRRITHITEVSGMEGDIILTQDIFSEREGRLRETGIGSELLPAR